MQIVHRDSEQHCTSTHRPGGLGVFPLLIGEEGRLDNFSLTIGAISPEFRAPRHRHNFDQLRIMLKGSFGYGRDGVMREGMIGYFGEGSSYEQQGIEHSETLVLQSGGASGNGYMGMRRLLAAVEELKPRGEFRDGLFTWRDSDGTSHVQDGYEAAWEATFKRDIVYPRPRYERPVFFTPDHFSWLPQRDTPNVHTRQLGQFNELGFTVSQLRIGAGASCPVTARGCTTLCFVYEGEGEAGGSAYREHSAMKVQPGESGIIKARAETTLLVLCLPCMSGQGPA